MNTISIIALILIGLGGIGAILLTIGQSISSNEDKNDIINTTKSKNLELKEQLIEIKKERDSLESTLGLRDANIHEQNKNIIDLSQKLTQKSEYIQDYLTGGEGFIFLEMRKVSGNKQYDKFMFQLNNEFDLPIYNIECEIKDYDMIKNKTYHKNNDKNLSYIKMSDYNNATIIDKNFHEMAPKTWKAIATTFPVRNCLYHAVIRTRNKTVIAKMTTLIIGDGDYFGFQILDLKGKILKEDINPEMPNAISDLIKKHLESVPTNVKLIIEED